MNGWWYPWGEGKFGTRNAIINGNRPGDYVRMWRHVHDIFTQVGATNVSWVWCINTISNTTSGSHPPMAQIYPGDKYVDWTGFDVYNRYPGWQSFNTAITGADTTWLLNTYAATRQVAPTKPMMLAEFGSKESRGDPHRKARWILDALQTQIPLRFPQIKAAVYFNWNVSEDPTSPDASLAIESSPQSQQAFATGIGSSYYASNTFADLPSGKVPVPRPADFSVPPTVRRSRLERGLPIALQCIVTCRVDVKILLDRATARGFGIRAHGDSVAIGQPSVSSAASGQLRTIAVRIRSSTLRKLPRTGRGFKMKVVFTAKPGGTATRSVLVTH